MGVVGSSVVRAQDRHSYHRVALTVEARAADVWRAPAGMRSQLAVRPRRCEWHGADGPRVRFQQLGRTNSQPAPGVSENDLAAPGHRFGPVTRTGSGGDEPERNLIQPTVTDSGPRAMPTLVTKARLLQDADGCAVSRQRARFDPVKPKDPEPDVAHRASRLGCQTSPSMFRHDPVAELGDAVRRRSRHQLDHPDQGPIRFRDDCESQGLPLTILASLLPHEFDRMAAEIRVREKVDAPPCRRILAGRTNGLHILGRRNSEH